MSRHTLSTAQGLVRILTSGRASLMLIALCLLMPALAATAEPNEPAAAAKCRKAEINPVTGHVLCIDPLGAAVEAAPADIAPPCKADESRGQWSWAPNCAPQPETEKEGMSAKGGS